jgi:hypothetical protein
MIDATAIFPYRMKLGEWPTSDKPPTGDGLFRRD